MPQDIPVINSVWRRKDNHNKYIVRGIANQGYRGIHKEDFPVMVIFGNATKTLATTLENFNELMERTWDI